MIMEESHLPRIVQITPRALPKGDIKLCVLCQSKATLECAHCRVTYYCDARHQLLDWVAIHEKICPQLVPFRKDLALTKKEQMELDDKKRELIAVTSSVAEGKALEGKHEEAHAAGQACLDLCIQVFGSNSMELVPVYLLMAEAHIGLGKASEAEVPLFFAEWIMNRNPDGGHELKARLSQALGRMESMNGNSEVALFHFANYIYHAAEAFGLDSTSRAYGYFHMGHVFAKNNKTKIALSLWKTVAQFWHSHLCELMQPVLESSGAWPLPVFAIHVEMDAMMQTMLDLVQSQRSKDRALTAQLLHCRAMLWFMSGDCVKARGFGQSALQSSQMSPEQELSGAIQSLLELVRTPPQTEPGAQEL